MPIVHIARGDTEEEARAHMLECGGSNLREYTGPTGTRPDGTRRRMWTFDTHAGLCLFEMERNGYDDSDFFMTIWNPDEGKPFEVCFASTRGWTYPCYASRSDATPEVRAAYDEWKRKDDRRRRALWLRQQRKRRMKARRDTGLTYREWRRLVGAIGEEEFENRILPLLKSYHGQRLRSGFRKSLAEQIWKWLRGESQYDRPLSRKQMEYV